MSRWMIEKDGTGIEKSGTGIEKSGTGIEKSGTGIEKSGTGIRRGLLACSVAALTFAGTLHAGNIDPAGSLQLVVQDNSIAVSWIVGDSIFSGIASLDGSYANLMLTEVALNSIDVTGNGTGKEVTGNGTGREVTGNGTGKEVTGNGTGKEVTGNGTGTEVTGNGTGLSVEVTGNGTGSSIQVTGNGTGSSIQVTGNGTGTEVTGNGTGSSIQVTGNGTGTEVTGNGTGSSIQVTGNGTGTDAITITLPQGTGMSMEVSIGCGIATVAIIDTNSVPIVAFENVAVIGNPGFCDRGRFGNDF